MAGNSNTSKSTAPSKAQGVATRYTGGKTKSITSAQGKATGRVGGGNKAATVQSTAQRRKK